MAILTLDEAYEALRLTPGDFDVLLQSYIDTMPDYLLAKTGSSWGDSTAAGYGIAKTAAKFIILQWFDMQPDNQIEIESLLGILSVIARSNNNG